MAHTEQTTSSSNEEDIRFLFLNLYFQPLCLTFYLAEAGIDLSMILNLEQI